MNSEGFAIDDSRTGSEVPWERPQVQPLIQFPRIARDHPRAVCTYVFRQALLGRMADVQTAKIYSYGQGNTLFQSVRDGLHETPHGLTQNGRMGVGGGNDKSMIRLSGADSAKIRPSRALAWETPTFQGY
jgi:hypothetical protein